MNANVAAKLDPTVRSAVWKAERTCHMLMTFSITIGIIAVINLLRGWFAAELRHVISGYATAIALLLIVIIFQLMKSSIENSIRDAQK